MNTNLFYYKSLNSIGGIETFFYQLGKKYGKDYDITLMYSEADPAQIKRLSEYIRIRKWDGKSRVKCKRCFVTFNASFLDFVDAEEYIQVLHGDYVKLGFIPDRHEKVQRYIAVSEIVRSAYENITGDKAVVCHNPYEVVKPRKILHLISATRLTPDKGSKRMETLAKALDEAGVRYTWDVYTDSTIPFENDNITTHKPRLDILDNIADADYFVQLSDSEGYCYSVVEALSVGTPVIVTDMRVMGEIGVVNGKNGFILPMDMSKLPIDAIYKGLKKFQYTPLEDKWGEFLIKSPPDYQEQMNETVTAHAIKMFYDLERKKMVDDAEEWKCTRKRAEFLSDLGLVEIVGE